MGAGADAVVDAMVAVKGVAAAVDALLDVDFGLLTEGELAEAVIELHRVASSLEAATTGVVAVTDARHAVAGDGARSVSRWVAWKCRIPHGRAARMARNGRALRRLPVVAAAHASGAIAGEHVRLLVEAAETNRAAFDRDVDMLVGHARSLNYRGFVQAMAYWRYLNAAEAEEEAAAGRDAGRRVYCSQSFGGGWDLAGWLGAGGGTVVANELARLERQLFDDDVREAKARLGRAPLPGELWRTAAQRRADAMVDMARRSARRGRRGAARPLFTVLVGCQAFAQLCELADGTVVTPGQLVAHLGEADIERVVFDGPSRVLDVGVRQRLFTGATRRAVEVRDRACWHPSCDVPAPRCDIDHIQPYETGGPTVQANGRCSCRFHHRQRHLRDSGPSPPN